MTDFQDSFPEQIWEQTYKYHEDDTVDDTFWRVAKAIASAESTEEKQEEWAKKFYELQKDFKGVPGGRILANAGTDYEGTTLLNCYVSPKVKKDPDSLTGILTDLEYQSKTLKSEGGWGENFSYIRPRGSYIHGIGVETPGAVKYMEMFDRSSDIITSGSGKTSTNKMGKKKIRKGAMLACLDCWHPDIVEFVTAKQNAGRLSKFNMSVNFTDDFMEKIKEVKRLEEEGASEEEIEEVDQWSLIFPDTSHSKYETQWDGNIKKWISKGYPTVEYDVISAQWLWDLVMKSTYNRAEPGVLFLDRANEFHPANYVEGMEIKATNPCSEQVLPESGVCCLGSLNLTQFVEDGSVHFTKLKKYTRYMVRFLDNVNDVTKTPLKEYDSFVKNMRRIGVGIMGWGSTLYMLKIPFASDEASQLRDEIMETVAKEAYKYSIDLAEEKGAFLYCDGEKHSEGKFIKSLGLTDTYKKKLKEFGIRNSSLLSIQPTGNTGIFANIVSGGIEPVFMPEYTRTIIVNETPEEIKEVTPKWYEGEWYETELFKFTNEGDEEILKGTTQDGTVYKIDKNRGLTREVPCEDYGVRYLKEKNQWNPNAKWVKTTADLTAQDHIDDLKGFTRFVDSAVSKTINVPHDYPYEDFRDIYLNAYDTGYIKGLTTYRAGTMSSVLSAKDEKYADDEDEEIIFENVKMPDSAQAVVKTIRAEGKKWYLTVAYSENPNRPFALFVKTNSHEKNVVTNNALDVLCDLALEKGIPKEHVDKLQSKFTQDANSSKIARAISFLLRHGVLIRNVVRALDKVEDVYVGSFIFQIKKFLSTYIKDGEIVEDATCDSCGGTIEYSEGCFKCRDCGASKCG